MREVEGKGGGRVNRGGSLKGRRALEGVKESRREGGRKGRFKGALRRTSVGR